MKSSLLKSYYDLKKKHPDVIIFLFLRNSYQTFDKDAEIVNKLLNTPIVKRKEYIVTGFNINKLDKCISIIIKNGYRVGLCNKL